jgi:hypothetical protein
MWKKILLFILLSVSFTSVKYVSASDIEDPVDVMRCNTSKVSQELKEELTNETRFKKFLKERKIPFSYTLNGVVYEANLPVLLDKCMLVYGDGQQVNDLLYNPVTKNNKQKQEYSSLTNSSEWLYIGFSKDKFEDTYAGAKYIGLVLNPDFPSDNTFTTKVRDVPWMTSPWDDDTAVAQSGETYEKLNPQYDINYDWDANPTASKANHSASTDPKSRSFALGRAIDDYCMLDSNCYDTQGYLGYFNNTNKNDLYGNNNQAYVRKVQDASGEYVNIGDNLSKFAVIHSMPSDYFFGSFTLYYSWDEWVDKAVSLYGLQGAYDKFKDDDSPVVVKSGNTLVKRKDGSVHFSTFLLPSYKNIFGEPDVAVKSSGFSITPDDPKSTNTTISSIKLIVENYDTADADEVQLTYSFPGGKTYCYLIPTEIPAKSGSTPGSLTITLDKGYSCSGAAPETLKYPKTNKRTSTVKFTAIINKDNLSPIERSDKRGNNKKEFNVRIDNPNAWLKVAAKDKTSVTLQVHNEMIQAISSPCKTSGEEVCLGGTAPTKLDVKVYDTKWTDTQSDDQLVAHLTPTEFSALKYTSIGATDNKNQYTLISIHTMIKAKLGDKFDEPTNSMKYRIEAVMPYYAGEVDFNGNPKYDDNSATDFVVVLPNLPDFQACKDVPASYIIVPTGQDKPHKMCAGNYPKFPSTYVEEGMGAYFFVNYQFFPMPMPKYNMTNLTGGFQAFDITESNTTLGNTDTFLYYPTRGQSGTYNPRNLAAPYEGNGSGHYLYRGRMMPTGAEFRFRVETVEKDSSNNEVVKPIAVGSVRYDIPSTCFKESMLDLEHKMGCDSILFFLPNDSGTMFDRPTDYPEDQKVDYNGNPITKTKLPLLNSGKHRFTMDARENQEYRYQHDDGDYQKNYYDNNGDGVDDGYTLGAWQYQWSNVQTYGNFN